MSHRRPLAWAVATALSLGFATPARAGECAPRLLQPQIVTAEGATIPQGGGVVVMEGDAEPALGAVGPVTSWRFVDRKRRAAPRLRAVAPGLTVLEGAGTRLDHARKGKLRSFRRGPDGGTPLGAPAVKAVELARSKEGYRITTYVRVELHQPAPADQFLVVYGKDGKVARSFGRARPGDTSVVVYTAGECTVLPDKTLPTAAGDAIMLAWLDTTGTLSARSAAVTVTSTGGDVPLPGP